MIIVFFMVFAQSATQTTAQSTPFPNQYPAHWWQIYSEKDKPSWEILPHQAKKGEVILSKRNELGLLSNFAATPFKYHRKKYASLEGFWQMMLYPDSLLPNDPRRKAKGLEWKFTREQVSQLTAFGAKHAGDLAHINMKKLGLDWVSFEGQKFIYRSPAPGEHYRIIWQATRAKLEQNPSVKKILLQTGDLILQPDHQQDSNSPPEWKYFELYMKLRENLQ